MRARTTSNLLRTTVVIVALLLVGYYLFHHLSVLPALSAPDCPIPATVETQSVTVSVSAPRKLLPWETRTTEQWVELCKAHPPNGQFDAEELMPLLVPFFDQFGRRTKYKVFIDIGANLGRVTHKMINYFTDADCRRYYIPPHEGCVLIEDDAIILSFEPIPANMEFIEKRFVNMTHLSWVAFRAAVSSSSYTVTKFFTTGVEGDEQSSLEPNAAGSGNAIDVPIFSLDELFYKGLPEKHTVELLGSADIVPTLSKKTVANELGIFLLKVDAEGFDYDILNGAHKLLETKSVRFLAFEYNAKWFTNNRQTTLQQVTANLYTKYEYACFWINDKHVIPLFDKYWRDEYEIRYWSNVMCGVASDPAFINFVQIYNQDLMNSVL